MIRLQDTRSRSRKENPMNTLVVLLVFLVIVGGLLHTVTGTMWKSNHIEKGD